MTKNILALAALFVSFSVMANSSQDGADFFLTEADETPTTNHVNPQVGTLKLEIQQNLERIDSLSRKYDAIAQSNHEIHFEIDTNPDAQPGTSTRSDLIRAANRTKTEGESVLREIEALTVRNIAASTEIKNLQPQVAQASAVTLATRNKQRRILMELQVALDEIKPASTDSPYEVLRSLIRKGKNPQHIQEAIREFKRIEGAHGVQENLLKKLMGGTLTDAEVRTLGTATRDVTLLRHIPSVSKLLTTAGGIGAIAGVVFYADKATALSGENNVQDAHFSSGLDQNDNSRGTTSTLDSDAERFDIKAPVVQH